MKSWTLLLLLTALLASAQTEPLVIVVHGVGGGNREDGWSDDIAKKWRLPCEEVTFRLPGRNESVSTLDFARECDTWARSVQDQMKRIVTANPGRRVIVVSHSWGTVVTKMALQGGEAGSGVVEPANLGVPIDQWVTLGSPLGRLEQPDVIDKMLQERVSLQPGKPPQVKNWLNMYDPEDPVSTQSHELKGADSNVEVKGGRSWWDISGLTAHVAVWTNPRVTREVREAFDAVSALPPLPKPVVAKPESDNKDPEFLLYQGLANALVRLNEIEVQKRNSDGSGDKYRIEYTHTPKAVCIKGVWYIAAGWQLKRCPAGDSKFYVAFERVNSDGGPNILSTYEVDAWVSREKIKWRE
jgi:pimeloyl-ACP methyl ester carboxylesterase